MGALGSP